MDVLIVDGDPISRLNLRSLIQDARFSVAAAASAQEARLLAAGRRYKCLLADQHLPDGDGVDLVLDLRRSGLGTAALLMCDSPDVGGVARAINEGSVQGYFSKPPAPADLLRGIQRACFQFDVECGRRIYAREVTTRNELLQYYTELQRRVTDERGQIEERLPAPDDSTSAHTERAFIEIQKAYLQTITSLTRAIEAKDRYTHGHSERVHYYSSITADILDLSESNRNDLRFASILHDIGKIGIPDSLLLKDGALTDEEHRIVARHALISESIISPLPFLSRVRAIVRQHHEHYDGSGYPDGLRGSEILLEARILAVADAFDAMRTTRPYRGAMTGDETRRRLVDGKGRQFCPVCVPAFLSALEARGEYDVDTGYPWSDPWSVGAIVDLEPPSDAD